jgi:hypothetical protein
VFKPIHINRLHLFSYVFPPRPLHLERSIAGVLCGFYSFGDPQFFFEQQFFSTTRNLYHHGHFDHPVFLPNGNRSFDLSLSLAVPNGFPLSTAVRLQLLPASERLFTRATTVSTFFFQFLFAPLRLGGYNSKCNYYSLKKNGLNIVF